MERLVEKYQPVDLSVGTPDFLPSTFVINALTDTVNSKNILLHQYSRSYV